MARQEDRHLSVVVIGLGRFGSAVAESLVSLGQEVLAIDENRELVERWADELTHVVQADTTDDEALRQLGVATSTAQSSPSAPTSRPAS